MLAKADKAKPEAWMRDLPVGRSEEMNLVRALIDGIAGRGGALLISGDPGVGKTMLLDWAASAARRVGHRVLRAAGVEFEAEVGYSGLNQLLLPLGREVEQLPPGYREALNVALGFRRGAPPERLVLSNAVLDLLVRSAAEQPLLVVLDDAHWLDSSSAAVLGSVARRLADTPVGLLAAARTGTGTENFLERSGVAERELRPLHADAAAALLLERFPGLAAQVRERVVADAGGNPLALLELPSVLNGRQRSAAEALPSRLPLTRRLQRLFGSRIEQLPAATRKLLLIAALEGTGDLHLLHSAAAERRLEDLAPAEFAQLVEVEASRRLTFRHPLIRSAVVELASHAERTAAHLALAGALAYQPERRAWHLSEASFDPDDAVATLVEDAARRVLGRGDATGAVKLLTRAAELSEQGTERARRLATAAYLGSDVTGDLRGVARLLVDARRADPALDDALEPAVAAAHALLNDEGDVDAAYRLLAAAVERHDGDAALPEALHTLMLICFFGGRRDLWAPFDRAIARLGPRAPEALALCSAMFADPAGRGVPALGRLEVAVGSLAGESDPTRIVRTGMAALYVDRLAGCRDALWRVVNDGRTGGAVASSIDALMLLSFEALVGGRWDEADRLAAEGRSVADALGYSLLGLPGRYCHALLAAARGDESTTRELADALERWAAPRGVRAAEFYASHARATAALGRGDFDEAYSHACAISAPGDVTSHPHALWVVMDLVEAAVRTGRHAEADAHVKAMRMADVARLSPRLALLSAGAAAIAARDTDAPALFEAALALPGTHRWPFELARVQLAYGERLRRAHAVARSRVPLDEARATFLRLGAAPWVAQASHELRATGRTRRRTRFDERPPLTPQEREIAGLAAAGLTNKQIGERLYLSHRTVGAHLYRAFPKLGVASRAALRDALADSELAGQH